MHMLSLIAMHVAPSMMRFHGAGPVTIGVMLMIAGLLALRIGLRPFQRLRDRLASVRSGIEPRVPGEYPSEVQPLIDELNGLLEDREKAVKRASAAAGDLAHGLKTPLALLAQEAGRVEASGNPDLAASISQQVERMSRQINYHLARARAAASGSASAAPCPVPECVRALVNTVAKLYAARGLAIIPAVAEELSVRIHREDLDEMLGNLLDNACKFAASRVAVEVSPSGDMVRVTVDDDGPGLDPALRSVVLERGVRVDQRSAGSGLGLAIVRDLAELYGGSLTLEDSPLGGLRASLLLPAA